MIVNRSQARFILCWTCLLLLSACADGRFGRGSAPDFTLPGLLNEEQYHLSALRGKVVYLTFWASWCGPCRQEIPFLLALHQQYAAQGLVILAVGVDKNRQEAVEFISQYRVPFPVADDAAHRVRRLYKVEGMPTHFIIDREGRIQYSHLGFKQTDQDRITEQVKRLLAEH